MFELSQSLSESLPESLTESLPESLPETLSSSKDDAASSLTALALLVALARAAALAALLKPASFSAPARVQASLHRITSATAIQNADEAIPIANACAMTIVFIPHGRVDCNPPGRDEIPITFAISIARNIK